MRRLDTGTGEERGQAEITRRWAGARYSFGNIRAAMTCVGTVALLLRRCLVGVLKKIPMLRTGLDLLHLVVFRLPGGSGLERVFV